MKFTSDSETLAKQRAVILYILEKVNKPISNTALLKLVNSSENMNYFYFRQFLLDLLASKYITSYINDNSEEIYELTPLGKETLNLVKDLIPGITKFKIDSEFKTTLIDIENTLSISADFTPVSENEYSVTCKIIENNKILFELTTIAGSREQAKAIINNWNTNAISIFPKLLNDLTI
ncbi:MAG: DUF4364 family protein [Lachnospiraceae bacterium]|jgi:predicted transcriptional regulator|nr:DUF4364 family protein [Lachnospiraceae bacterium]